MLYSVARLSVLVTTPLWCCAAAAAAQDQRPNIIVVLADDMGFSDLGCFGGEIDTPHLDKLATGGLRFTNFYNSARCCPTRAALLTGLYPHQAGMGHMTGARPRLDRPFYAGDLNSRSLTIAQVLSEAGYRTYMAGKWHLTPFQAKASDASRKNWPLQRGFDRFYGTIKGGGSFWDPAALTRDNQLISPFADNQYTPKEKYYYTDAISDNAVQFINDHASAHRSAPFFMYVAYTAAHWPMHAPEGAIQKYKGRYDEGYDPVGAARLAKAKNLGVIDPDTRLHPSQENWSDVGNRQSESRAMEVYAAMVETMDRGIGDIVAALQEQSLYDNTLVLYLQDNGACAELMGRRNNATALRRTESPTMAPLPPDYLQLDIVPKQTRDGYPIRQGIGVMPGPPDTYLGYGRGWASVSNTPFREFKHWVHEGGISTPLIAHWPVGVAARGDLCHQPGHVVDVMATCIDVAGAKYPAAIAGEPITALEGSSLRPAFHGGPIPRKAPIFFEHEGNRAVRDGRWKLVAKGPAGPWELYDLLSDRTELNDLATEDPQRVAVMVAQWEAWAHRVGVLPWIGKPAYAAGSSSPH